MSDKSGAMGELCYLIKMRKNIKREKMLQIMSFQSQVLELFYLGRAVTALHSTLSVAKCYGHAVTFSLYIFPYTAK
jgi:hypothetical protein